MKCPKADVEEAAKRWGARAHPTLRLLEPGLYAEAPNAIELANIVSDERKA